MRRTNQYRWLFTLWLVVALLLSGCAPAAQAPAAPAAEAPAEAVMPEATEPTAEAPAAAEPATEEPAAMPEEEEAAFDLVAEMDAFVSAIPEGYWAVGTVEKLKEMMEATDVLLLDVREDTELESGVIPGAIHIPMRQVLDNLDKIPTDRPVVVYCGSGHRAAMVMTVLQFLGYENVRSFPPSWKGWSAAGEPADERPAEPETYPVPELDADKLAVAKEFLASVPEGYYAIGTVEKLKEFMEAADPLLVDVREEKELAENGWIPGAVNIPIRTLVKNLDQIPMDRPVVTYCASGHRAAMSLAVLQMLGYENVRAFPPSFKGWVEAGEPVEKAQ